MSTATKPGTFTKSADDKLVSIAKKPDKKGNHDRQPHRSRRHQRVVA
jgi:hypothetical protein